MDLKERVQKIKEALPAQVALIAVTKGQNAESIKQVIQAGITHIGENRLQEAKEKISELPQQVTKHFIGHLQTNKVRDVVALFDMIQSVDSLKLAEKIDAECGKIGKIMPVLIEVNTSSEPQKGGEKPEETNTLAEEIAKLPHLKLQGLMTIGANTKDPEKIRACFRTLSSLFAKLQTEKIPNTEIKWLSMGMSDDYKIALAEGANMVRLGRILFQD